MKTRHTLRYLAPSLAALLVLALFVGPIAAQTGPPSSRGEGEKRARETMHELVERLELTDEQKEQLQPILADAGRQLRELREKYRSQERSPETMESMRKDAETVQSDAREQLTTILTEEQLAEYDRFQKEQREQRRKMMRERRGGG